jgi:very-short-patch-repair endonuclease
MFKKPKKNKIKKRNFCSKECLTRGLKKSKTLPCGQCNKPVTKLPAEIRDSKSGKIFCSRSCSVSYHNLRRKSINRSKIENKFGEELQKLFPKLEFIFNNRQILDGYELDIYIPELKLAIEWNGIIHYQPIYGKDKLQKTQYKDHQKQLICQKLGIDLIVICDLKSNRQILTDAIQQISSIIRLKLSDL